VFRKMQMRSRAKEKVTYSGGEKTRSAVGKAGGCIDKVAGEEKERRRRKIVEIVIKRERMKEGEAESKGFVKKI
jgi:hypothetical protein